MTNVIRRFFRKTMRNAGFQRRIAPDFVDVMNEHGIDLVLDVGANDGDYGREIRDRGYKGKIISFEPNPNAFLRLLKSIERDENWVGFQCALGDSNCEAEFAIAANDVFSSFKRITEFGRSNDTLISRKILTKVHTLDYYLESHNCYNHNIYLKIDTQGFEMEVLRGSVNSLPRISAIQAEISLVHTYVDQPDWLDVIQWMRNNNFELATAICNSSHRAQVREFDFVFVNHG